MVVVETAIPGIVIVPCTINHCGAVNIAPIISRGVSYIDDLWGGLINIDVLRIVFRILGGNFADLLWSFVSNNPGAIGSIGFKPNGIVA